MKVKESESASALLSLKHQWETEEEEAVGGACGWLTDEGIDHIIMRYEVTGDATSEHCNKTH